MVCGQYRLDSFPSDVSLPDPFLSSAFPSGPQHPEKPARLQSCPQGYSLARHLRPCLFSCLLLLGMMLGLLPPLHAQAPAAPTALSASPGAAISLAWSSVTGATSYKIYRGTSSGAESTTALASPAAPATSYTDSTVTSGTYFYKVAAVNASGTGTASPEASATVGGTALAAPKTITADAASSQITVNWKAVSGAATYNLYRGIAGATPVLYKSGLTGTSTDGTFTDTGLTNGTAYAYQVAAVNAAGQGTLSYTATAIPGSVPPAPTAQIAISPGSSALQITWEQVPGATGYNVYRGKTSGGEGNAPYGGNITTGQYTDNAPVAGTINYYQVTAYNANGESARSGEVSGRPGDTVPAAPTATGMGGTGKVTVRWTAVSGASSYNVYRGAASNRLFLYQVGPSGLSFTDAGLTNGTPLYYSVVGANASGEEGPYSNIVSATPLAPASLTASVSGGFVVLSWGNVTAATGYIVEKSTDGGTTWSTLTTTNSATLTYTDTAVSAGQTYSYRVTPTLSGGQYDPSSPQTVMLPPSAPTNLAATGGAAQVGLTWTGVTGATSYNLYRGTSAGGEAAIAVQIGLTGTSYTDPSLTNGQAYFYTLTAVNAGGESGKSSEASATPVAGLSGLSVYPTAVTGGSGSTGTITLDSPAGANGASVSLSSDTSSVTFPAGTSPVLVPANATRQTFSITTGSVSASTTATITATLNGVAKAAMLSVNPSVSSALPAIADSYVRDGSYASTNYGTATTILVKKNSTAGANRIAYLKFNLAGIAGSVTTAKLRLYGQHQATGYSGTDTVAGVSDNTWTETGITWNNQPTTGASLGSATVTSTSQYTEWDVTSYLQSQKSAGATQVSFAVTMDAVPADGQWDQFNSREASSSPPQLVVTGSGAPPVISITRPVTNTGYTPPATVLLSATATAASGAAVSTVQFYQNGTLIGTAAPGSNNLYTLSWNPVGSGTYNLTAKATDAQGNANTSAPVSILVTPSGGPLTLTSAGQAAGYTLTTFVDHFPYYKPSPSYLPAGPKGMDFPGGVLVADCLGDLRLFADSDGQQADALAPANPISYGRGNTEDIRSVNGHFYMSQQANGKVVEITAGGAYVKDIASIAKATSLAVNPNNGHLFVATLSNGTIMDLDPLATVGSNNPTVWMSGLNNPESMAVSSDGTTLYVGMSASPGDILGYKIADKSLVFDYAQTPNHLSLDLWSGISLGSGTLDGKLVGYTNAGSVYQIDLTPLGSASGTTVTLATGGTRGCLVGTDPNGSLLVNETDQIARLTPGAGGRLGNGPPTIQITSPSNNSTFPAPASISISATATAYGATVSQVQFYQNGTLISGTVTNSGSTYTIPWNNVAGGSYTLTAVATDSAGLTSMSNAVTIHVNACSVPVISTLTLNPNPVVSGNTVTGTVTLTGPALESGQVVSLSSSSGVALVPQSVVVEPGVDHADFTISTTPIMGSASVVITATSHGVSAPQTLTVLTASSTGPGGSGTGGNGGSSTSLPGPMMLTPAALAAGFRLTLFAQGFPSASYGQGRYFEQLGPLGSCATPDGGVLVSGFSGGSIYKLKDQDGQTVDHPQNSNIGAGALQEYNGSIYLTSYNGVIDQLDKDGNVVRSVMSLPNPGGLWIDPHTGMFVADADTPNIVISATLQSIEDATNEKVTVAQPDGYVDGLTLSQDGSIVYVTVSKSLNPPNSNCNPLTQECDPDAVDRIIGYPLPTQGTAATGSGVPVFTSLPIPYVDGSTLR